MEEKLVRLAKKPGVKATLALDRATGAILRTSGQVATLRSRNSTSILPPQARDSFSTEPDTSQNDESQGLPEFAAMVMAFINTSGKLVEELDTEVGIIFCCR
jgi:dynein light chain roadblock-type